jgi:hypothetical protein
LLKKIPHATVLSNNTEYCLQEVKLLYIYFLFLLSLLSPLSYSAGGGFAVGLMDGLGFAVGLDLGFEGGGLRWVSALMVGGLGLRWVSA